MANGGTELAENKANNCPPLAGDQGGGKKRGYHAKKTKDDDANNYSINKHSRFAGCLQKKVCGIYPKDCGVFVTVDRHSPPPAPPPAGDMSSAQYWREFHGDC
ncbi:hypothetical protein B188_04670 [Candidatus Brocadiaceae bacterium B188]|nr:hypothetical protein [Candidatus Brocadia sapporoensis]QQR67683.1 MAG: hypothetical protein IPI25_05635 [Candidatus Brocadia sp.]RZV59074.1 MAG: hypothetical protein EX330_04130 [Candidatus Brocadia sp. BROELEC01]TWU52513.1 hypothetical protein B188_04670 [Candidatus Brocadiaceae bacterium B188]